MPNIRQNKILAKNRDGKLGVGLGLVFPSAESIQLVGLLGGYDFINLDGEHGLFSPESIDQMVRTADGYGLTVTARVPNIQSSTINLFLDRGVMGILGPHIETAEHAKQLVDACRFVPDGQRSWGGGQGTFYNDGRLLDQPGLKRTDWMAATNKEMIVSGQLETTLAFENLDEILAVEGIDAFAWGSNDLAQSMGLPGQPDHPDVKAAETSIQDRIHAAGRKMQWDMSAAINLPSLILDGAEAFAKANA
jgi:4-hydroxy-2-oxoheptanedioate aldolase